MKHPIFGDCEECKICERCPSDTCLWTDHPTSGTGLSGKSLKRKRNVHRFENERIHRGEPRLEARLVQDLAEDNLLRDLDEAIDMAEGMNSNAPEFQLQEIANFLRAKIPEHMMKRKAQLDEEHANDPRMLRDVVGMANTFMRAICDKFSVNTTVAQTFYEARDIAVLNKPENEGGVSVLANDFIRSNDELIRRRAFANLVHVCEKKTLVTVLNAAVARAFGDTEFLANLPPNAYRISTSKLVDGGVDKDEPDARKSKTVVRSPLEVLSSRATWASSRLKLRQADDDYARMSMAKELKPVSSRPRVPLDSIRAVLEFLEKHSLGFAGGKTKNVSLVDGGTEKVAYLNMPTLLMETWRNYDALATKYNGFVFGAKRVGFPTFKALYDGICKGITEKHSLSYYFTDAIWALEFLEKMAKRARDIWGKFHKENANPEFLNDLAALDVDIDAIIESFPAMMCHIKYTLRQHVICEAGKCLGDAFHCARFAVGVKCDALHDIESACKECVAFASFPMTVRQVLNAMKNCLAREYEGDPKFDSRTTGGPVHEISTMLRAIGWLSRTLNLFHRHVVRGVWQNEIVNDLLETLPLFTVLLIIDHKQKVESVNFCESSAAYFGKKGISVLSTAIRYRATSDAPLKTHFLDVVVTSNKQDASQVQTVLEEMVKFIHLSLPNVKRIIIVSDNGAALSNSSNIGYVWHRNLNKWDVDLLIERWVYFEAQCGKTVLDTHFAYVGLCIRRYARSTKAVCTPVDVYDALVHGDGIKNTSTMVLNMDDQRTTDSTKPAGDEDDSSMDVKGMRKAHDIMFVSPSQSAQVGEVRMFCQTDSIKIETLPFVQSPKFTLHKSQIQGKKFVSFDMNVPVNVVGSTSLVLSSNPIVIGDHTSHEKRVEIEICAFTRDRSKVKDCIPIVAGPLGIVVDAARLPDTSSKSKKNKAEKLAMIDDFKPEFRFKWSEAVVRKTVEMSDEIEKQVEQLYMKGEANSMKHTPFTALQHLMLNDELVLNWMSQLEVCEENIKKVFMKLTAKKKKTSQANFRAVVEHQAAALSIATSSTAPLPQLSESGFELLLGTGVDGSEALDDECLDAGEDVNE